MSKKALFLIDLQNGFILDRNTYIIENIRNYIKEHIKEYSIIAYSKQFNLADSIWVKQHKWNDMLNKNSEDSQINEEITELLFNIGKENPNIYIMEVEKLTASIFKGQIMSNKLNNFELIQQNKDYGTRVNDFCKGIKIEEIDFCGLETNVCVLASVIESFDLGYLSYVIESCSETGTTESNHIKTIDILRYNNMVK